MWSSYPSFPGVHSTTFNANTATVRGAAIYITGYPAWGGPYEITNTIMWGNSAPTGNQWDYDSDSGGYPILWITSSVIQGVTGNPDIISEDPMLGNLANHGGYPSTIPLLAGSSAIDAGNDVNCLGLDAREFPRPQGVHCDIGAYEYFFDTTPPVVDEFTIPALVNHLTFSINSFLATDDQQLAGYYITVDSGTAVPADETEGWTIDPPYTWTVKTDGTYTLYPWVKDAAGNVSGFFATPRTITVDTTAPVVASITRLDADPSRLASVRFLVTFSEDVIGVDLGDFSLTTTGEITDAHITDVSGGPKNYTVTADTGSGNGTLRLDVKSTASIADNALNPLTGIPYTVGEVYTIDKTVRIYLPMIVR